MNGGAAAGRWRVGGKGKPKQLQLQLPTWGGRRKRKRRRKEQRRLGKVPHRKRPALWSRHPVHATWRVLPHVWNLRSRRCFSRIAQSFSLGRDRFGFRLVHFSVQGDPCASSSRRRTRGRSRVACRGSACASPRR